MISVEQTQTIHLGRTGEQDVTEIVFNIAPWLAQFGQGNVLLNVKRACDTIPYPANIVVVGNTAVWTVSKKDVESYGTGKAELTYLVDGQIKKSVIYKTYTEKSLADITPTPEDGQTWLDAMTKQVLKAEGQAVQSESYAHGGTGARADEDTDNAKYYKEQADLDAQATDADRQVVEQAKTEVLESAKEVGLDKQVVENVAKDVADAEVRIGKTESDIKLMQTDVKSNKDAVDTAKKAIDTSHADVTAKAEQVTKDAQQVATDKGVVKQTKTDIENTVQKFTTQATKAVEDVNTAKTQATKAVEDIGATQVQAVGAKGTEQVSAVTAEGNKQVARIAPEVDNQLGALTEQKVDTKLNELVTNGTLEGLLDKNLDNLKVFESVEQMKASTKLEPYMGAITLGYYQANDGGAGVYQITRKRAGESEDGGSIIFINHNLVARLVVGDYVTPEQFGAKGDGVTDDSDAFTRLFNYLPLKWEKRTVFLECNKVYINNKPIPLLSGTKIIGNNSTIKVKDFAIDCNAQNGDIWDIVLQDINFIGNDTTSIAFTEGKNIRGKRIINCYFNKFLKIFSNNTILATNIVGCLFNAKNTIGDLKCYDFSFNNCFFNCSSIYDSTQAILTLNNAFVNFNNCFFDGGYTSNGNTMLKILNVVNCNLHNCFFDYSDGSAISVNNGGTLNICNCTFRGNGRKSGNYIHSDKCNTIVNNCSFLLPHIPKATYNPEAYIIDTTYNNHSLILSDNSYDINFYRIRQVYGTILEENAQIHERKLYGNNILPFFHEPTGNIKDNIKLYTNNDGIIINGELISGTMTMFVLGEYNTLETVFKIPVGKYIIRTGGNYVRMQIKYLSGETKIYNDMEVLNAEKELEILNISFIINIKGVYKNKLIKLQICPLLKK